MFSGFETLPRTRAAKILRCFLKAKKVGIDAGDVSTMENYFFAKSSDRENQLQVIPVLGGLKLVRARLTIAQVGDVE
jgi:hypothetical protein